MLTLALLTVVLCVQTISAEQVPCNTNAATCETAESQSVVNGKYYCCNAGFRMTWVKSPVNAQMECACDRYYHVSDCLEGQAACQGATSMTTDGTNVKCCKHGAKMNSVSNTLYNGVLQNYCRCLQYMNIPGYSAMTSQNSIPPAMLQEMQMMAAFGLLPEEMVTSLSQMNGGGARAGGFSQFTTFLEGLLKGLTRSMNPEPNNATSPGTGPGPVNRRRNRFPNLNNNNNNNNGAQGSNFINNRPPRTP